MTSEITKPGKLITQLSLFPRECDELKAYVFLEEFSCCAVQLNERPDA